MKGMSRDKCGAAACAGFMKTVILLFLIIGCCSKAKKCQCDCIPRICKKFKWC